MKSKSTSSRERLDRHGSGFNIFWKAYPKKLGNGKAESAWTKLKPDDMLLGTMLAKIEQAKQTPDWNKDGGQFIPYPATWLNAKRWKDEFTLLAVVNDPTSTEFFCEKCQPPRKITDLTRKDHEYRHHPRYEG